METAVIIASMVLLTMQIVTFVAGMKECKNDLIIEGTIRILCLAVILRFVGDFL